jgi:DNA end-binding protein Ku
MSSPRKSWSGRLKISLVTVPVVMFNAHEADSKQNIKYHRYHASCGTRPKSDGSFCGKCNRKVGDEGVYRGYEYGKGKHVPVTDADFDAIEIASSSVLEITTVTNQVIDPARIDGLSYLVPVDGSDTEFETVRLAMADKTGIGTYTKSGDTNVVALKTHPKGFLVYHLRAGALVRSFDDLPVQLAPGATNPDEVKLATQLFRQLEGTFDYANVRNAYYDAERSMLDAKIAAKEAGVPMPVPVKPAVPQANVSSLAAALKASLAAAQAVAPSAVTVPLAAKLPSRSGKPARASISGSVGKRRKTA